MTTSPVDEENMMAEEPLLRRPNPKAKGGKITLPFIIANEAFERLANHGLRPNMILYLTQKYGLPAASASTVLLLWSAATDFMPLFGAFLADSYVGRYPMIGFGSILCFLGMVMLWLTTIIPQTTPSCYQVSHSCKMYPTTSQLLYLYFCFGLMSIGSGGIRSSSIAFGADQLDIKNNHSTVSGILESFFSWYSVFVNISVIVAISFLVYIQEHLGWNVGFGIPALLMFMSALAFFVASPFYVKLKAEKSVLTELAQVVVASYKNRDIPLLSSLDKEDTMYHHIKGSIPNPSNKLRCLNKACIIRNSQQSLIPDWRVSEPWSFCTVSQVEELKAVIRIIPIWSTGVLMSVSANSGSFPVLQATTMDRRIFTSNFEIPAGSFGLFSIMSMVLWRGFYDRLVLPLASKIKGRPIRLGLKAKMGIGIFATCLSMSTAAMVESTRRKRAIQQGFLDDPQEVVNMSAIWLLPQHILIGLGDAFNLIGQAEFYYTELPKSMSSIALTLNMLGGSIGNLIATLILNTVDCITKRGNQESWVSTNMNKGHYDYYCWLLCGLGVVNCLYYVACSKAYGPCNGEASKDLGQDEVLIKLPHEPVHEHVAVSGDHHHKW